jgi:NAD+ synthase (glutamine-hydrolysing)
LKNIRIALAQINPTVGDLSGNSKKIISYIKKARKIKADIIAFPELAVTGYPPEDLLLKPHFVQDNIEALHRIKSATENIVSVIGFVDSDDGIYNAAAVISNGKLIDIYHKKHLPNYGVFDEYRYFRAGNKYPIYDLSGIKIGVTICEDIWHEKSPAIVQALNGASIIINLNASPYHIGKALLREDIVSKLASKCEASVMYVNMVGGQDELVFDGGSFISDEDGNIVARGEQFRERLIVADIKVKGCNKKLTAGNRRTLKSIVLKGESVKKIKIGPGPKQGPKPLNRKRSFHALSVQGEIYGALVLGTKDYVHKNGFKGVVVGMSGGIDSALVTTIAVDALGKDNVHGIFMPSVYTSKESYEDVNGHVKKLGIKIMTIPIDTLFNNYLKTLSKFFKGKKTDITEENLQARIRGNLLMAFSNKFGCLVLTTGNKSEMSVGYATLYGDMAGGFAVIKDVPKMMVFEICEWRNRKEGRALIPERILWKEPTAELKKDQLDTDSLPPYSLLDPILKAYVEDDRSFDEIANMGCDMTSAKRVISMIDHSEYKRRQAPPGIKITARAFGRDRRFPITNKYKSY